MYSSEAIHRHDMSGATALGGEETTVLELFPGQGFLVGGKVLRVEAEIRYRPPYIGREGLVDGEVLEPIGKRFFDEDEQQVFSFILTARQMNALICEMNARLAQFEMELNEQEPQRGEDLIG